MVPAHVYAGTEEGYAPVYAGTEEGYAQQDSIAATPADTTAVARKKHPWLAGMEIVGFNVALVGFNSVFYKDDDWSQVTMENIGHNISHRYWIWDHEGLDARGDMPGGTGQWHEKVNPSEFSVSLNIEA